MTKTMTARCCLCLIVCLSLSSAGFAQTTTAPAAAAATAPTSLPAYAKEAAAAYQKGLTWLTKNQNKDGSWGGKYTVAVTSLTCLSLLGASDEPFAGEQGKALTAGLTYLLGKQDKGVFITEGHTWIHSQGFATLALSEAYGRTLFCKTQPDLDVKKLKETIPLAVKAIEDNQSTSGGWWYTPGSKGQHEGSTTVTAVQALVSASNFGFKINADVLDKGFEYLKRCQNRDGGFDYQLDDSPDTVSMKEGTAADVSTLALMKKFDFAVMVNGFKFLIKLTPEAISKERFPYYGHFYGCMGMKLFSQEMPAYKKEADPYVAGAIKDVLSWQKEDGTWPVKGWMLSDGGEKDAYGTAFATLVLSVDNGRLSIFNRKPPKLPQ